MILNYTLKVIKLYLRLKLYPLRYKIIVKLIIYTFTGIKYIK